MRKRTRLSRRFTVVVIALGFACVVGASSPAYASAIALSSIIASDLTVTAQTGVIAFDPAFTQAFASAQNSLGDVDANVDGSPSDPATASAAVTWAAGSASSGGTQWSAQSGVNIPGFTDGAASSQGQALWSSTFTITCPENTTCSPTTNVNFGTLIDWNLSVFTQEAGLFAFAQATFNLLLDGETVLFWSSPLSIGPNDAMSDTSSDFLLTNSVALAYGTPYSLFLRVDAESNAANIPEVPEPATLTLLSVGGLITMVRVRRTRLVRR